MATGIAIRDDDGNESVVRAFRGSDRVTGSWSGISICFASDLGNDRGAGGSYALSRPSYRRRKPGNGGREIFLDSARCEAENDRRAGSC